MSDITIKACDLCKKTIEPGAAVPSSDGAYFQANLIYRTHDDVDLHFDCYALVESLLKKFNVPEFKRVSNVVTLRDNGAELP